MQLRLVRRGKRLAAELLGPRLLHRLPQRTDLPLSMFGLQVGRSGRLHLRSVDLVELVAEHGSPLHVVDGDHLSRAASEALGPFRDPDRPGADIHYSYKTNPVPAVLERLHDAGVGAEVISEYELWLALKLGVPGPRIIYNGPAKSEASLRLAIERDVRIINANSLGEVDRIADAAAEVGRPAPLGLRVALPGGWGGQFGIVGNVDVMAPEVSRIVADDRLHLDGLHIHRGITIRTADELTAHVEGLLGFAQELRRQTGWVPRLLDLGGSLADPMVSRFDPRQFRLNRFLGSDLLPPDPATALTVGEASQQAATMVADWAERVDVASPAVVMEPGRALTGNTQFLLTSVLDVKTDTDPPHAILDAGINLAEAVAGEYHQLFSASRPSATADRSYRLAGPICTPADVLYNSWRLHELAPGDVLAIMNAGAYLVPFSTSFSFPRPAIVECSADTTTVVRSGETFDDMVALDMSRSALS
jgi:diaminopimelate decarboxylase